MATTMYFEKTVLDQGGRHRFDIEFGSSTYYDDPSIYLTVDDKTVIMDRKTAHELVEAMKDVGRYLALGKNL